MAFFSDEMILMLDTFREETSELMDGFDMTLARAQQTNTFSLEEINELFRAAHTIKSSSAMMGLEDLSKLTHRLEDLFSLFRDDPSKVDGRVGDVIDHFYAYSDFIRNEIAAMDSEDYKPADSNEIYEDLFDDIAWFSDDKSSKNNNIKDGADIDAACDGDCRGKKDAPDDERGYTPIQPAKAKPGELILRVRFKADVAMVNVRAMVVEKQLSSACHLSSCVPSEFGDHKAASIISKDGLLITMTATDLDKAHEVLDKNPYVATIEIVDSSSSSTGLKSDANAKDGLKVKTKAPGNDQFISVRWDSIHELQDIAGGFLVELSALHKLVEAMPKIKGLRRYINQLDRLNDELLYRINAMAMLRVSTLIPQLSRMVRDMCRSSHKSVNFTVHGEHIEIDRNLYSSISEPLIHIIRNAVDHGIESANERLAAGKSARGNIELEVENQGSRVVFRVSDDGCGMDADAIVAKAQERGMLDKPASEYSRDEALQLIMKAGFSTSDSITQYSGRGVGMDVVGTVVHTFGGRIEVESEPGKGTAIALFMPVSVTSVETLGLSVGPYLVFLPLFNLDKIMSSQQAQSLVFERDKACFINYKDCEMHVLDLHALYDLSAKDSFYIVGHSMNDMFCVTATETQGQTLTSNKPLPSCLGARWQERTGIRNAIINADGSIGFALSAALLDTLAKGTEDVHVTHIDKNTSAAPEITSDKTAAGESVTDEAFEHIGQNIIVFMLGKKHYGMSVDKIERVRTLPRITPVPLAPAHLVGLTNYRNHIVAVYDLADIISIKLDEKPKFCLVVKGDNDEYIAFTVSSVLGIYDIGTAFLAQDSQSREFPVGVHQRLVLRLDPKEAPVAILDC